MEFFSQRLELLSPPDEGVESIFRLRSRAGRDACPAAPDLSLPAHPGASRSRISVAVPSGLLGSSPGGAATPQESVSRCHIVLLNACAVSFASRTLRVRLWVRTRLS